MERELEEVIAKVEATIAQGDEGESAREARQRAGHLREWLQDAARGDGFGEPERDRWEREASGLILTLVDSRLRACVATLARRMRVDPDDLLQRVRERLLMSPAPSVACALERDQGYLFTVVANQARDMWREERRRWEVYDEYRAAVDGVDAARAESEYTARLIQGCIDRMSAGLREAVLGGGRLSREQEQSGAACFLLANAAEGQVGAPPHVLHALRCLADGVKPGMDLRRRTAEGLGLSAGEALLVALEAARCVHSVLFRARIEDRHWRRASALYGAFIEAPARELPSADASLTRVREALRGVGLDASMSTEEFKVFQWFVLANAGPGDAHERWASELADARRDELWERVRGRLPHPRLLACIFP